MLSLDFSLKELPGHTGGVFCFVLASLNGEAEEWAGELPNSLSLAVSLWLHLQGVSWEGQHGDMSSSHLSLGFIQKICGKGVITGTTYLPLPKS